MNELPEGLLSRRLIRGFLFTWLALLVCGIAVRWHFSRDGKIERMKTDIVELVQPIDKESLWKFSPKTKAANEEAGVRYVSFSPDGRTLAFAAGIFWPLSPEEKAREEARYSAASENWQLVRSAKLIPRHHRVEIQLWDVPSRSYKTSLLVPKNYRGFYNFLTKVLFSRDGTKNCLLSSEFLIWNIKTGAFHASTSISEVEELAQFPYPKMSKQDDDNWRGGAVWSGDKLSFAAMVLNPDLPRHNGEYVYPGQFMKIWHRDALNKAWREAATIPSTRFNNQLIYGTALNHDGTILAVRHGRRLELFDTKSLRVMEYLPLSGSASELNFSLDGRYLLSNVFPRNGGDNRQATSYF